MSRYMDKSDFELGKKVQEHLLRVGLEGPVNTNSLTLSSEEKQTVISRCMYDVLNVIGLDMSDDSICDTPTRVAKMFVNEMFWGLDYSNFPKCTAVENKMNYDNSFVLERNITTLSCCEHHLVAIDGFASVAYIPKNKVLGLSKLNRIVEFFSKRPQVQERLTEQIAEIVSLIAETPDVAVHIDASHYCVKSRGIQDVTSSTQTFAARGCFRDINSPLRREFLSSL